jgi:hypothetical protein
LIQSFQGTSLTPRTIAFVVNVVLEEQETSNKENTPISSLHFPSSTYIDFSNSFYEDVSLLVILT